MGSTVETEGIAIASKAWAKDSTTGEWVRSPQAEVP
jgi:hypothetical protein